jgi:hypothetical protein
VSLSALEQATTMQAFLPLPPDKLEYAEIQLGFLAFPSDVYPALRLVLVTADATDPEHQVLQAFKNLLTAPLKTLILVRRGQESTYAKKEIPMWLHASAYVALHWNPHEDDAYARLHRALQNTLKWMSGNRASLFPSPPEKQSDDSPAKMATANLNPLAEMFKPKATLDFTGEVLKKLRKGPPVP